MRNRVALLWFLALAVPLAASASSIYSFSHVCVGFALQVCGDDFRFGDPASSSVSRSQSLPWNSLEPDSGFSNFGAGASATGFVARFLLDVGASGGATGQFLDPNQTTSGAQASAFIRYIDTMSLPGTGTGTLVVPWSVDGSAILGDVAGATFGFGCSTYPTGTISVSVCTTNHGPGGDTLTSGPYNALWRLEFPVVFGVENNLWTDVGLSAGVGRPGGFASADFAHTGLMQAAMLFDAAGHALTDVPLVGGSGLDYRNPQGTLPPVTDPESPLPVPEPGRLALLASGLAGAWWRSRRRCRPDAQVYLSSASN